MGYKEGGAIANILASKLIDQAKDVYAYTFASPYTLYNNADAVGETDKLRQPISRTGYLARYDSIFNVVNEVDAYCFIMPQKLGFSRYGRTCFGGAGLYNPTTNTFEMDPQSVGKIVNALVDLYKGNTNLTRTITYAKDTNSNKNQNYIGLYNVYQRLIRAIDIDRNHKEATATGTADRQNNIDTIQEFYARYRNVPNLATFINTLEVNYDKIKRAGQEDQYYKIAKNMNNADITNVVNLYDNRKKARKATGSDTLYFTAIEDMSKWYVDNVATYQTRLQTETIASLNNYNTKLNHIKEYKLKNSAKVESSYKVATNNQENAVAKSTYSNATPILKATENAVNNYKTNYSQIKFSNLAYYPCSDIDTGTDTYKKAGDDCVRFAFACFKKMDSNFISDLEQYSGLTWDNINSTRLAGKDGDDKYNLPIIYAMSKLGFEIYDTDGNDKLEDYDKDGEDDYEIKSIPSNFKLQIGDFVACSGHVHFCLEDDNDSRSNTDKDNFGWGSVCREYPKHYSFNVESAGNNKYQINGGGMKYNRVYRYTK